MRVSGLLAVLAFTQALSASAQNGRPPRLELSLQGTYYPLYLDWGQGGIRRLGVATGLLVRPRRDHLSFELGASLVQQQHTTSREAPHIRSVRALAILETPVTSGSRAKVFYGAGLSLLRIDPQVIDCGDFPLCNEWSHGDLTTLAPTGVIGLKQPIVGGLALLAGGRLYFGLKRWEPDGRPMLWELALGLTAAIQ